MMRWISGLRNNKETFYSFSGGANDPDAETLKKLRPRDHIEANDMFYMIFMFYGRNTRLSGGTTGFQEALVQFGLDVEGIGNPVKGLSGPEPAKSDTFGIWDRQATGILRSNDGSPFGVEYKNVRGEGLSKRTLDSLNKVIKDSNNYWNKQLIK
ncbi:hypothetical protein ODZ84_01815 [Chryseobacterium fluminis]|uniref:hypothetical protein n=1 Tax=Chryseobacterium fluminis TaxID=2983606 RepID=UPI002250501B|nr:hypothetical protein [Chryseobacterium sp. MMS21-Ot14]UZT98332.1 hypothetical protein ODZ84_01815 [Chryseobacterium sp. MMS21-Ot14]